MIKKEYIMEFINKYTLGGEIFRCEWKTSNGLSTKGITGDKAVFIDIRSKTKKNIMNLEDPIEMYDTPRFTKLISPLNEELEVKVVKNNFILTDKDLKSTYAINPNMVLPSVPKLKHIPKKWEINTFLEDTWIDKLLKTKGIIDSETFTLFFDDVKNNGKCVLGYASVNCDRLELPFPHNTIYKTMDKMSFKLSTFYSFLKAHKDNNKIRIKISSQGCMQLLTENDNFKSMAFFIETTSVN